MDGFSNICIVGKGSFALACLSLESDFHNLGRSSICKLLQICIGNPEKLPALAIVSAALPPRLAALDP